MNTTLKAFKAVNPILSEYRLKDLKRLEELEKEVSKFFPCTAMVHLNQDENSPLTENSFLEYGWIDVAYGKYTFEVAKREYSKHYSVTLRSLNSFSNLENHTRNNIASTLTEPQNIGVLTAKKLENWFNYYGELYMLCEEKNRQAKDRISAFMDTIKDLPIRWYNSNKQGSFKKGGLEYQFEIGKESVSEKIHVDTYPQNLETFLKMSANGL